VAEDGAFWAEKRCGSKPILTTLKSRDRSVPYPRTTNGYPLVVRLRPDPEEDLTNEQGLNFTVPK
jgi:hypothetical protein